MAKKPIKDLMVGIDIGTSKVVAIVGEITSDGKINVVGLGSHPSQGLKRGVVVNIESAVNSIQNAVEEAELKPSPFLRTKKSCIFYPKNLLSIIKIAYANLSACLACV
jgi:cell division protein FtsA